MTVKEQLNLDLKAALRSGDDMRKTVLRQLLAGLQQAELEKRTAAAHAMNKVGEANAEQLATLELVAIDDAEAISAIQKEAKSRRESIVDAAKASRADLVAANAAELRIIESYLPQQLSRDEVAGLVRAAIAETGATDLKQLGAVMKVLAPQTKGRADGRMVNEVVRELLQAH